MRWKKNPIGEKCEKVPWQKDGEKAMCYKMPFVSTNNSSTHVIIKNTTNMFLHRNPVQEIKDRWNIDEALWYKTWVDEL